MIDPCVRSATASDADQLVWLEGVSRRALTSQRGGPRWLDTHPAHDPRWLDTIESSLVFVAHVDEVVVGYLVASIHADLLRIDDVFVHQEAREVGFGDELLAAAIDAGRRAGLHLLEGESLPGDRDTKNLYERAGIKARLITVSTEI